MVVPTCVVVTGGVVVVPACVAMVVMPTCVAVVVVPTCVAVEGGGGGAHMCGSGRRRW